MPYLFQTTNFVVYHLSWDLAKCNINTTQCITATDSVFGNRCATSGKNSKLKLILLRHHFLIISCSYALNPAPAPTPAGFAIMNPAKSGLGRIWKKQIWYSTTFRLMLTFMYIVYNRLSSKTTLLQRKKISVFNEYDFNYRQCGSSRLGLCRRLAVEPEACC